MNQTQSLQVTAHFDNRSTRDVTGRALYEVNDSAMLEVTDQGVVRSLSVPGKAVVMVRYAGKVGTLNVAIPAGTSVDPYPASEHFIDQHVFANLETLGIPASPICDDATFLRRVTLDIAGRIPTLTETKEFLASTEPNKREDVVDRLLTSPDYADYFANKWTTLLKNRRDENSDIAANFAFHAWLRDTLLTNRPYHQMVRELLAATGTVLGNPPVAWYKRVKDPKTQIEDVAQLFLGVRMQCAQCHHHPFERWSQDDYYALTAFFSRVGRKPSGVQNEDLIFHQRGIATAINPRTGQTVQPAALGDAYAGIPADKDPRLVLADWMSNPENPFFGKALVNRYWKHFMGRGLVEPEDDLRDTNPATNPELLDALERYFVESNFDLKGLVRAITTSSVYQLSSAVLGANEHDRQNYSRFYPRRMSAEVMLDNFDQMTGARTDFPNLPRGTRAVALPDNSYNASSAFLRVFGRPENESVCECERVQSASLAQSLHMLNAGEIQSKLSVGGGRAETLAKSEISIDDKISELYLTALSRPPTEAERNEARAYLLEAGSDVRQLRTRLEDVIWALVNTKEFLFNH
jgi:hypothetical protein